MNKKTNTKKSSIVIILSLTLMISPLLLAREAPPKKTTSFNLGSVVVKDRAVANIEEAATTTVITEKEIKEHSDKSLADSLKMMPGLVVETHTKGHERVKMRGFEQDKIAILVDGIILTDVYSTDLDLSNIPVMNISEIIVNRGTSSALYGPDGAVGSINIITKKPSELFARCTAEYGLYNNYAISIAQGAPIGDFYYWITGSILNSGGFKPSAKLDYATRKRWFDKLIRYSLYPNPNNSNNPYTFSEVTMPAKDDYLSDSGTWDHTEYRKYNLSAKAAYAINKNIETGMYGWFHYHNKQTNTYQHSCFSDYRSQDTLWRDPLFEVDQATIKKAALRNRSFVYPEAYNYAISPYIFFDYKKLNIKLNLFLTNRYAHQEGYASTDHSYVKDQTANVVWEPFQDLKNYVSYGVRLYPSWKFASWNRLTLAVLYRHDTFVEKERAISATESPALTGYFGSEASELLDISVSFFTIALEDEISFFDNKLSITAGVSYDAQKMNYFTERTSLYNYAEGYMPQDDSMIRGTRDSFNPVVGIVYLPTDFLRVRAAGSMKTRFPTLSEYSKIINVNNDYRLKPERSYSGNTGLEFCLFDDTLRISSDYFISIVHDRIEKIAGGSEPPVNIEKIISQGVENIFIFKKKKILNIVDISLLVSYTYLHARNHDSSHEEKVNKGEALELTPEHQVTLDLRGTFYQGTGLGLWGTYSHGQVMYVMKSHPTAENTSVAFSTAYFETVPVNNPLLINAKIWQEFYEHVTVYVLCKNIFDDYNPDPFNPGPGRMFFMGVSAEL
ncbi:MAG: TonB-dependent receptor plug domain-containing protein [bacterium]|nr:TonB-dependent receptor plug domain-containing protein [bacterium]